MGQLVQHHRHLIHTTQVLFLKYFGTGAGPNKNCEKLVTNRFGKISFLFCLIIHACIHEVCLRYSNLYLNKQQINTSFVNWISLFKKKGININNTYFVWIGKFFRHFGRFSTKFGFRLRLILAFIRPQLEPQNTTSTVIMILLLLYKTSACAQHEYICRSKVCFCAN